MEQFKMNGDKLEKLKMERQFMLEKLPLVGIFRR